MNTLREKVSATREDLSIFVARKIDELEMKLLFVGKLLNIGSGRKCKERDPR